MCCASFLLLLYTCVLRVCFAFFMGSHYLFLGANVATFPCYFVVSVFCCATGAMTAYILTEEDVFCGDGVAGMTVIFFCFSFLYLVCEMCSVRAVSRVGTVSFPKLFLLFIAATS